MLRVARNRLIVCVLVVVTFIITPRGGLFAAGFSRKIVIFTDGTLLADQEEIVTNLGGQIIHVLSFINALAVQFPLNNLTLILLSLLNNLSVVDVFDDLVGLMDLETPITVLNPGGENFEWGQDHIQIPQVYSNGVLGSGVKVAVLDTGIDFTHPDLASAIVGGFNAIPVTPGQSYYDDNGHGTHIAGIIAAQVNGQGIIGTASQAQLVAVKVLGATGAGFLSDFINGLQWVHDHGIPEQGIRVLNMSLSFAQGSVPLQKAIDRLSQKNAIMVASAGNCGQAGGHVSESGGADGGGSATACNPLQPAQHAVLYPAAYPGVMAVAATDILDHVTNYSRYGPGSQVAVAAPGGAQASLRLLSTVSGVPGGGYGLASGTSQAAAHASGVVALALQCKPGLSFNQVVAKLQATAQWLVGYSSQQQGAGLIQAAQLMQALQPCIN